jgi:hypothetical protein
MKIKAYVFEKGNEAFACGTSDASENIVLASRKSKKALQKNPVHPAAIGSKPAKPTKPKKTSGPKYNPIDKARKEREAAEKKRKKVSKAAKPKPVKAAKPKKEKAKKVEPVIPKHTVADKKPGVNPNEHKPEHKEEPAKAKPEESLKTIINKHQWDSADEEKKKELYDKYMKLYDEKNKVYKEENGKDIEKFDYVVKWEQQQDKKKDSGDSEKPSSDEEKPEQTKEEKHAEAIKAEKEYREKNKKFADAWGRDSKSELVRDFGVDPESPIFHNYEKVERDYDEKTSAKIRKEAPNLNAGMKKSDPKVVTQESTKPIVEVDHVQRPSTPLSKKEQEALDKQLADKKDSFAKDLKARNLSSEDLIKEYGLDENDEGVKKVLEGYKQKTDEEIAEEEQQEQNKTLTVIPTDKHELVKVAKDLAPKIIEDAKSKGVTTHDLLAVYRGETTYQRKGRKYLSKASKFLGESTFLKMVAYSAAFFCLGPFALLLVHEAMPAIKEVGDDARERDEKVREGEEERKANRLEANLRAQAKHVEKIVPKHFSVQQRQDFRHDFGRLKPEEFKRKHWQALSQEYVDKHTPNSFHDDERKEFNKDLAKVMNAKSGNMKPLEDFKNKYKDKVDVDAFIKNSVDATNAYMEQYFGPDKYMTYADQRTKLLEAVPNKRGEYEVPLYGDVVFKGNEKELKAHLRELDERDKGKDYTDDDDDYRDTKGKLRLKSKVDPNSKTKKFDENAIKMTGPEMWEHYKNKLGSKMSEKDFEHQLPIDEIKDRLEKCEKRGRNGDGEYTITIMGQSFENDDMDVLTEDVMSHKEEISKDLIDKMRKAGIEKALATDLVPEDLKKLPNDLRSKIKEVHSEAPEGAPEDLVVDPDQTEEDKKEKQDDPATDDNGATLEVDESEVDDKIADVNEDPEQHKDDLFNKLTGEKPTESEEEPVNPADAIEDKDIPEPVEDEEKEEPGSDASDADVVADTVEKIVEHYLKQDPAKLRKKFEKKYPKLLAKYNEEHGTEDTEEKTSPAEDAGVETESDPDTETDKGEKSKEESRAHIIDLPEVDI